MDLYQVRSELALGKSLTHLRLRVTDYARVSTEHVEQKKSLQNQVEHFRQYIEENPNWTYVEGYVDDGITGTSDVKRDSFMQMLEDARSGKFDLIVTKEISRFSRNTLDSIKYTRELLSYGVAVLFVNDNINTALPDAELRLTIMASMAQDEIRRLSERVKFGMERAIERGEILGNNQLYGYEKDKTTGRLSIVAKEAEQVRRIYELYAIKEYSLSHIVAILNKEGKTTRLGKQWSITTISRMLENPKYKGYYCARKSEIVDYMTKKIKYFKKKDWILYENQVRIPPIVTEELWEHANTRLELRKKSFQNRRGDKALYKNRYTYSAKIYCKEHGTVFHRRTFRKVDSDKTWVCSTYLKQGKKACTTPNLRESELDFILRDILEQLGIYSKNAILLLSSFYKQTTSSFIEEKDFLLEKEIKEIEIKKKKLLSLYLDENLPKEELKEYYKTYDTEIKELKSKLQKTKKDRDGKKNPLQEIEKFLIEKGQSKAVFDKIVGFLLDSITVFQDKTKENSIHLDIFLSYELEKQELLKEKEYIFKRGYDTKGTKRYEVTYQVHVYSYL